MPDCEYEYGEEVLPPEKISYLAKTFNDYKIIDLQHEFTKRLINKLPPIPRGKLLKSYISKEKLLLKGLDGVLREYPPGTWIISVQITDKDAQQLYNQKVLTGLSITVKEKEHADTIIKYLEDHEIQYLPKEVVDAEKAYWKKPKRILMKDVENPVAFTVSLVKQPCVYGAKFCNNSCLTVNKNKLKENKILNIKDKIKTEINNFIDGLEINESTKEDIEQEADKQEDVKDESIKEEEETVQATDESAKEEDVTSTESEKSGKCSKKGTKTIYGRKVKIPEVTKSEETDAEAEKDGETGTSTVGGSGEGMSDDGDEEDENKPTPTTGGTTEGGENKDDSKTGDDDKENSTSKGKVKKEAKKSEETESDKEEYLSQEDVESFINSSLKQYSEEVEKMVYDGIQEALDDYLFAGDNSYKETVESDKEDVSEDESVKETEEEVVEEAEKNYATPEMVQSMFEEQFASFKSSIMESIKNAQKESIKSYSKAINPSNDGFKEESNKTTFKPSVQRDFNGCRIRKKY